MRCPFAIMKSRKSRILEMPLSKMRLDAGVSVCSVKNVLLRLRPLT